MKTFVTILALLALFAVVPAFAEESAPSPAPSGLTALSSPAPACSSVPSPGQGNGELPSWLTAKPLIWTGAPESLSWLSSGCAAYCRDCGGCCAILGPNSCACC
jgi:hypothetical protein